MSGGWSDGARPWGAAELAAALEMAPVGIVVVDAGARVTHLNRRAAELLGVRAEELRGSLFEGADRVSKALAEVLRRWHADGRPLHPQGEGPRLRVPRPGGDALELDVGIAPSGPDGSAGAVLTLATANGARPSVDTDAVPADGSTGAGPRGAEPRHGALAPPEAEVGDPARFAQRLRAVGRLAGGFAHDFNNLLAAILGSAELALESGVGAEARADLELIVTSARRGQSIVERLLGFSRRRAADRTPHVLSRLVLRIEPFLRERLPSGIDLRVSGSCEEAVLADPDAIHQLLLNLVLSAANDLRGEGWIRISCRPAAPADVKALGGTVRPDAGWLELAVRDAGSGETRRTLDDIVAGRIDTGRAPSVDAMGLVVAFAIVEDHGGVVDVRRVPGEGSTVRCFFPACGELAVEGADAPGSGAVSPLRPLLHREDT